MAFPGCSVEDMKHDAPHELEAFTDRLLVDLVCRSIKGRRGASKDFRRNETTENTIKAGKTIVTDGEHHTVGNDQVIVLDVTWELDGPCGGVVGRRLSVCGRSTRRRPPSSETASIRNPEENGHRHKHD
jgi:hypothetical protein